jgi:hypothetical protein
MERCFSFTKGLALVSLLAIPTAAKSQESVELTAGADIVSSYIWRGQDLGNAAFQPTVGIGYKGLSLSAWGSYGLVDSNDTKEFDLTLSYSADAFSAGITDYFCIASGAAYSSLDYFQYEAHKTAHVFEAFVGYDFKVASLTWYTNFAGADGLNKSGKRAYSSYIEAKVPFTVNDVEADIAVGAVPFATDFYADANGFAVTNITLTARKKIEITPSFSLPLFVALTANPSASKCYLTAGLTF